MLCWNDDWLVIVIVTLPALALSLFVLNFSCCGSDSSDSCWPPAPVDDAAPPELVAVWDAELLLSLLDPPQPATASSAAMLRMSNRFIRCSLTSRRNQKLQQRLLCVKPVLGLIPDRGTLAIEDFGGDLLARVRRQAVECDRLVACVPEQCIVEPVRRQQRPPAVRCGLVVAHADPHVGVKRMRAVRRLGGVVGHA